MKLVYPLYDCTDCMEGDMSKGRCHYPNKCGCRKCYAVLEACEIAAELRAKGLLEWAEVVICKDHGNYHPGVHKFDGIPKGQSDRIDEAMQLIRAGK